ncbi:sensor histidine kinase [Clostridium cellulovorans]|uniref:histidine kinase n=1 Tax=Clostridium cellulovorans (strain ATCC 35296 / DSM 3052 / OCM 3 / 743B) TaxID=573061 RepID=D9SKT9_CLOC7|nr:sensor histidine kinase [Clostridium cellulovorans]ADL53511.1 multi-sensor signal transduction histidine kinase [Clostridium cellulovorans 743B]
MENDVITRVLKKPFQRLMKAIKLKSIQFIITISFTAVTILAMLFVGIISYSKFADTSEKNAASAIQELVDQINSNIEYYLNSMVNVSNLLSNNIYLNPNIQNSNLMDQMNVIQSTRNDITTLAVFSETGELLLGTSKVQLKSGADITSQGWFENALNKSGNLIFSLPHVQNLFQGKYDWVVSLSRTIDYTDGNTTRHGVLLVDMNYSNISQLCQNVSIGKNGYLYIVDSENDIIYHPQQQLINIGLKKEKNQDYLGSYIENSDEGKQLVTIKTVKYTNWKVVAVANVSEIVASKKEIMNFVIWILISCILLIVLTFSFISAKISQPIKQLEKSMKKVEEGNFDIQIDAKGEDEVVKLSQAFNLMLSKVRSLMSQIVIEQESKRKSELDALQSQINPHFLYNTLDSIVWMAENGKSQDVITMVTSLAKLFRISISKGRNIISVEQEIEHARNYLIIQKIRFKNKFTYDIETDPETMHLKTTKLILQPLIENSIYHGIEYMQDQGYIKISTSIVDGKLLFEISDNGLGIEPEKLPHLLEYETEPKAGSGIGVKNVHERIQLTYGKEYGLEIKSELEEGTNIKIWLPIVEI